MWETLHNYQYGALAERVSSLKFLVVLINKDLILNCQDNTITKTARPRLFFLCRLRRPDTDSTVLCNSYKSILTDGITTLSVFALASTVPLTAQHITRSCHPWGASTPSGAEGRPTGSSEAPTPKNCSVCYWQVSIQSCTTRLMDSSIKWAVRLLKGNTSLHRNDTGMINLHLIMLYHYNIPIYYTLWVVQKLSF